MKQVATNKGVALFRPVPLLADSGLADGLSAFGFSVCELAVLKHQLTNSTPAKQEFGAYVLSSATAVDALRLTPGHKLDPTKPVLAVGQQTAKAATDFGFARVFAGEGGMLGLFQQGLPWLLDKLEHPSLLYIGVTDPRHNPASKDFAQRLADRIDADLDAQFQHLFIEHWPIYQTTELVDEADELLVRLRATLPEIEYLSFFSKRNASVFMNLLKRWALTEAWLLESLATKTLVCNSQSVADVFTQSETSIFRHVLVAEYPNRDSYLTLMKSQI